MNTIPTHTDVLVVGGGLAGLSCALELALAGRSVTLIERRSTLGGRAASRTQEGFVLNQGPHALYLKGAACRAFAGWGFELPLNPVNPQGLLLRTDGEATPLPVSPLQLATMPWASWTERLGLLRFFGGLGLPGSVPASVHTTHDWAEHLGGLPGQLLLALARLTSYANDPAHQGAQVLRDQLRLSLSGVGYLDHGWQQLVDRLAQAAREAGAQLHTGVGLTAIESTAAGWQAHTSAGPLEATAVVLALPPAVARRLHPEVEAVVPELHPAATACLDLGLRRLPRPDTTFAIGLDAPLYFSVHSATARLAPEGSALVHLAWARAPGDDGDHRPDSEALMDRLQPGWREELVMARYLPALHATTHVPGVAARPEVLVPGAKGLFLAGDWVGAEGMLADAAVASAREAARQVIQGEAVRAA